MFSSIREKDGFLYLIGYDENGKRIKIKTKDFKPYYFLRSSQKTEFKSFPEKVYLEKVFSSSINYYHNETNVYPQGTIFGNVKNAPILQYIRETKIYENFDPTKLRILFFDIEVFCELGFPKAEHALHPVVSITARIEGEKTFHTWYLSKDFTFSQDEWFFSKYPEMKRYKNLDTAEKFVKPFKASFLKNLQEIHDDLLKQREQRKKDFYLSEEIQKEYVNWYFYVEEIDKKIEKVSSEIKRINDVELVFEEARRIDARKFSTEIDLLINFVEFVSSSNIDVISGWNSESFDIPYIINRCDIIVPGISKKLSPFGVIEKNTNYKKGKEKVTQNILGLEHFDLMQLDLKYRTNKRDSYKLNDVSIEESGKGKVEYDGSLIDLWLQDKQKYLEYNIGDVECLERIHGALGYIPLLYSIAHYSKTPPNYYCYSTFVWGGHIYNCFLDKGIILPSSSSSSKKDIQGAFVKPPLKGLFGWVISVDLTSLYPSIIRMCNMSHEMIVRKEDMNSVEEIIKGTFDFSKYKKNNEVCMPTGLVFSTKEKGLITEIIENLFNLRKKHKKESQKFKKDADLENVDMVRKNDLERQSKILDVTQLAEKVLLNSFYGATAVESFELFNIHYAESITTMGQVCNRYCSDRINEFLNITLKTSGVDYIIAGDTDSLYINVQGFVDKLSEKKTDFEIVGYLNNIAEKLIEPKIKEIYEEMAGYIGVFENTMSMKREVIANGAFWMAAKTYAMLVFDNEGKKYDPPKEKIVGIKVVRSDTPKSVKPMLKRFIKKVLLNMRIKEHVDECKKEILSWDSSKLNKPASVNVIDDYFIDDAEDSFDSTKKGAPFNVKGSINYNFLIEKMKLTNKYKKIEQSDRVFTVHLKEINPYSMNACSFFDRLPEEFGLEEYLDKIKMYNSIAGKFFTDVLKVIDKSDSLDGYDFELF